LDETIRRENHIYDQSIGRSVFQRPWNENMKAKKEKRKKRFKSPFFKNNLKTNQQGKSTQNEHKKENSFGKRPRK
jgi:hypothetical protein